MPVIISRHYWFGTFKVAFYARCNGLIPCVVSPPPVPNRNLADFDDGEALFSVFFLVDKTQKLMATVPDNRFYFYV